MNSEEVPLEVLGGVFVTGDDIEVVPIDLHIAAQPEVSWSYELLVLINIFVLSTFKEFALHYATVLLGWLEDRNGIISQKE